MRTPALNAVASDREHLYSALDEDDVWQTPGIYALLGPSDSPGLAAVKVGKSARASGVRARLQDHRSLDWWDRAVVFVSNERRGFRSSDVSWLEGEVSRRLRESGLRSRDIMPQGDHTITLEEAQLNLRPFADAVLSIMNLIGVLAAGEAPEVLEGDGADEAGTPGGAVGAPGSVANQMSWRDAAAAVMRGTERVWHVSEILDAIADRGLRDFRNARTPEATLRRDLAVRGNGRFEKVGAARFRLVEPDRPAPRAPAS